MSSVHAVTMPAAAEAAESLAVPPAFLQREPGVTQLHDFPRRANSEDVSLLRTILYSFIAYRQINEGVIWVDELYTAACVRQQGVARWLLWQIGSRQRVELQVSKAETEQAEVARHSYTSMGLKPLGRRGRSHVVTEADRSIQGMNE